MALLTNHEGRSGGIAEAMAGMDAVVAYTTPGPGIIDPAWIGAMAPQPIVFACANPTPEIWPWRAREAGAAVVATGRSDLENQINNAIAFPGIFRGALDVRATSITDEMAIAGAYELADYAADPARGGLRADHLLPTMDERDVVPRVAAAVGAQAVEQGIARRPLTRDELDGARPPPRRPRRRRHRRPDGRRPHRAHAGRAAPGVGRDRRVVRA